VKQEEFLITGEGGSNIPTSVGDPDPHGFGPPAGSGSIVRGTDPDPAPDPSLFS
jgi:hypothetical protein